MTDVERARIHAAIDRLLARGGIDKNHSLARMSLYRGRDFSHWLANKVSAAVADDQSD